MRVRFCNTCGGIHAEPVCSVSQEFLELQERAEKAEGERDRLLGMFDDYEMPCEDFNQAYTIWQYVLNQRNTLLAERRELREACITAKDFYERCFEVTGGCDHSVGVCECQDREDYATLLNLLEGVSDE